MVMWRWEKPQEPIICSPKDDITEHHNGHADKEVD